MTDTPETDAFRDSQFNDRVDEMDKLYDLAEKLERERDEARKEVGNLQDQRDFAMQVISRLERERDEARQKMADALQEVDLRTIDYERMKETLRFILNECDWERLGGNLGGGDERIGKSIRAILNKDEN